MRITAVILSLFMWCVGSAQAPHYTKINNNLEYIGIKSATFSFIPRNGNVLVNKDSSDQVFFDSTNKVWKAYSKKTGFTILGLNSISPRITFDTSVTLTGSVPIHRTIIQAAPLAKGHGSTDFTFTQSVNVFTGAPNEVMKWGYNIPGTLLFDATKPSIYYQMESRYVNAEGDMSEMHLIHRKPNEAGEGRRISSDIASNTTKTVEHYNTVDGFALRDSTHVNIWYGIDKHKVSHTYQGFGYSTTISPAQKIVYSDTIGGLGSLVYRGWDLQAKKIAADTIGGTIIAYNDATFYNGIKTNAPSGANATWKFGNVIDNRVQVSINGVPYYLPTTAAVEPLYLPSLQNSWTNLDTALYAKTGYYRDASGLMNIQGALTGGATATSVMFTIHHPDLRPKKEYRFTCEAGAGISSVKVMTNGNVVVSQALTGDPTSFIFLGNIKFRTD